MAPDATFSRFPRLHSYKQADRGAAGNQLFFTHWGTAMSALRQVNARALVAILAGAAFAVSACTGSTEQPAPPTTPTSQQPASSAEPTSAPNPTSAPDSTGTPSSTPAPAEPDFPPAVSPSDLQHGSTYWGVYVTVVRADDHYKVTPEDQKRLDAGKKSLTDLGYEPDSGAFDNGCEMGMQEQLNLDPQRIYAAVRIFFATQAQAQQFVDAYQPGIVGTAKVTLYCMD